MSLPVVIYCSDRKRKITL